MIPLASGSEHTIVMRHSIPSLLFAVSIAGGLAAQPNLIPGTSVVMNRPDSLTWAGQVGTFPNARNGFSMSTTICNNGNTNIAWFRAMDPRHPYYGFLVCRESGGRFEQISDRTFVKHSISAANSRGCGTCQTFGTVQLGPNCSDTYSVSLNRDRFNLGPANEIDPWLGAWEPVGSHFDRGEPNVGPPQNMDGQRSLTRAQVNAMNPVTHRIEIDDADLMVEGRYYYSSYVVITGEPEDLRDDNMATQLAVPRWNGSRWTFNDIGTPVSGSPLVNWAGATVDSAANGKDDGRLYVGVVVTGPDSRGMWHYEYAVHNRDNSRGAASFRIPICPSTRVLNASVRDIDKIAANDWVVSVTGSEISFLAGAENAIEWNTIYNFSFDADAAPVGGQVTLDQARPGPGAGDVTINARVPGTVHNEYLGDGCGNPAPTLSPSGSPPVASIPNANFGLQLDGLAPGASAVILLSATGGNTNVGNGCTFFIGLTPPIVSVGPLTADPGGQAGMPLMIPNNAALEGAELFTQAFEIATGGPLFGGFNLTNGLKVRIGNNVTGCP